MSADALQASIEKQSVARERCHIVSSPFHVNLRGGSARHSELISSEGSIDTTVRVGVMIECMYEGRDKTHSGTVD